MVNGIANDIGCIAKNQHKGFHQEKTGEIKEIKPECTPAVFNGAAKRIVTKQADGHKKDVSIAKNTGKDAGQQTPELTLQDQIPVKAKGIKQHIIVGHFAHEIDDGVANDHKEHQIGNTDILVTVAEPLKFLS